MVTAADFYPTLLEIAGLPLKPEQHVDGLSFAPALAGEASPRQQTFWHYPHYSRHAMGYPSAAIRDGDWKLIRWFESEEIELYNLSEDIGERNNLAPFFPERTKTMSQQLNEQLKAVQARIPERK